MKNQTYKPNPNLSSDGVYHAVVRFLPNIRNTKNSIISRKFFRLNPLNGEAFYVDFQDPQDYILKKAYWQLHLRDREEANSRFFSTLKHYSFVKVIEDPQRPELEGTIQIFEYGYSVKDIINEEIENLFKKDLSLKVSLTSGFLDFEGSSFVEPKSPINTEETLRLYNDVEDLEDFGYKPWTEEQRQKVEKFFSELNLDPSKDLVLDF